MRQQKSKDCFHKIIAFQLHKNCKENASICEHKCQQIHLSNNTQTTVDVSRISLQHKKIKNQLIEAIKVYNDKFTKEYDEIMKNLQKKFIESLRQMEREILNHLINNSNLNNDVMEKIENERLEKLKCHEIYSLLNDHTIEQKINSAALLPIYEKHLNGLRLHYKNLNWNFLASENKKSNQATSLQTKETLPENTTEQDMKKQNQSLKIQIQSLKAQLNSLENKGSIEARNSKRERLTMKTWAIFRVITKTKLKKQQKEKEIQENKEKQPVQLAPTPMEVEHLILSNKPSQEPQNQEVDSQDILDFIQKKQRAK